MIQFNLLPDVKIEYLKARHTKRLVMLGASIATVVSLAILIMLFIGVNVVQRNHLKNLRLDIDAASKQLQEEPNLTKILTVQKQLSSIDGLHESKPAAERIGGFLSQVTPTNVSIATLEANLDLHTLKFSGSAESLKAVNTFVDTLKFTKYKANENKTGNAFSNVVLATFSRTQQADSQAPATYEITLMYDPIIMISNENASLEVPNTTTTRSSTERPETLFQPELEDTEDEE